MFEINKEYEIKRIYNGNGAKGDFAFITIEDKKANWKFADKLTICVWGENVDAEEGDMLVLKTVQSFGLKAKKDQKGEWSKELQCVCTSSDFDVIKNHFGGTSEMPPITNLAEVDDDKLPF